MRILVFHRVALFAHSLAVHLTGVSGAVTAEVAVTEAELALMLARGDHEVVLFTRADMVRCLTQWRHHPDNAECAAVLVLAAPVVFPQLVAEARSVGIHAVLDVNLAADQFVAQLGEVVDGTRCLPDSTPANPRFGPALAWPPHTIDFRDATDIEIVRLLSTGLSDKEITGQLSISHQTVRNRLSRILRDSGLDNRTQLAAVYLRHEFMHLLS